MSILNFLDFLERIETETPFSRTYLAFAQLTHQTTNDDGFFFGSSMVTSYPLLSHLTH